MEGEGGRVRVEGREGGGREQQQDGNGRNEKPPVSLWLPCRQQRDLPRLSLCLTPAPTRSAAPRCPSSSTLFVSL